MAKGLKVDTTFFLSGSQSKNVGNNWLYRHEGDYMFLCKEV